MKPTVYLRTHFIDGQQYGCTFVFRTKRGVQRNYKQAKEFYAEHFPNIIYGPRSDNDSERDLMYRISYVDKEGKLHVHKFSKQTTED